MFLGPSETHFWVRKLTRGFLKDPHPFQRHRKNTYSYMFSIANTIRKGEVKKYFPYFEQGNFS
jgi:hypothetical protein